MDGKVHPSLPSPLLSPFFFLPLPLSSVLFSPSFSPPILLSFLNFPSIPHSLLLYAPPPKRAVIPVGQMGLSQNQGTEMSLPWSLSSDHQS